MRKKTLKIHELEKRILLDASLGSLASSTVFGEQAVNAAPVILDSDVSVTGSTTDFTGESLSISTTGDASDQLSINNEGGAAGQIGISGTDVTYGGTIIGTITSDGTNGNDLIIALNGNASKAAIERLIENIGYANNSDNPAANRTVNFALGAYFSEDMDIAIVPFNEGPSVGTNTGITLAEGGTQTITSAHLGITDPDDLAAGVTINITTAVINGRVELSTNAGVGISSFTLDQLNGGLVRYVHNAGDTTSDSFGFTVSDGDITTSTATFNITVSAVNDAPVLDSNGGADVFQGFSTDIGGTEIATQFGNEILRRDTAGTFGSFHGSINGNVNTQISLIFTTGAVQSNANPGQVLFETGNSTRGLGLYLNNQNQLALFAGTATAIPRLTSALTLATSTQYAVVVEIDATGDQIRLHYAQAGDFDWFEFGRAAEGTISNWTDTNIASNNGAGYGVFSSSYGGFNGTVVGSTPFTGTLNSPLILTRFPATATIVENENLRFTDVDTTPANIVYTITTDVSYGTLYKNGMAMGLGDTFTQADLNSALIKYTHNGAVTPDDSFGFSVSDGTTVLNGNTYAINVDTSNTQPDIPDQTLNVSEHAANGANVGTVIATDPDTAGGQILTYSLQGGTGAGIFAINAATGLVTVVNNSTLDYETTTSYTLVVRVTDDGPGALFYERTITVDVQDIYENTAPVIAAGGPFALNENVANNTVVGTVSATDAQGDGITYSITSGNTNTAFKINATTGVIQVNGTGKIDFENLSTYTLSIRATDNNGLPLFSNRNFVINVNDLNEAPTLDIERIIEEQNTGVVYSVATGNFYRYVNSNVSYAAANAAANAAMLNGVNGHLVTITSAAENTFVDGILGNHIWLAASDAGQEGKWLWLTGPEAGKQFSQGAVAVNGLYENWNGTEPNSGAGANDAYMNTNGTWYDQAAGGTRYYVIEWEGKDVINNTLYKVSHTSPDASDLNVGDSVGFMQAYDPEGDTLEFSIQGGNVDGVFEIDTNTGEIRIADTANLNPLVTGSYTLTIRVQEQGAGLFADRSVTINFDNAFSLTQNNAVIAEENNMVTITTAALQVSDSDTAAANIVYSITGNPANGRLELSTAPGIIITGFTQSDIDNNRLRYIHDGTETLADSFTFSVTDGTEMLAGQVFNIAIDPINQGPSIATNTGTTIIEGGSRTITSAMLAGADADDTAATITYTASAYIAGHITVDGVTQNTFTQDDINNNRVVFVHDGSDANGRFNFSLADGGEDGAAAVTGNFTLTYTNVNDAPEITTNTSPTVLEGGTVTITTAHLNTADPDDSGAGLIYTLSNIQNGFVELSTNPGVPVLTFTQTNLAANQVVFRHAGGENQGRFSVSVADGGEDGAAPDSVDFVVNRNPVNDAPTIGVNAGTSVNQNSIVILKNAVLRAADTDDSGVGLTYTITGTANGQLEFLSNPNVAVTSFTQDDIDNSRIIFRHSGPPGAASFNFTLADGGEDGAGTVSATFNLTVDNTNDAPVIVTNASPTFAEGSSNVITTAMLDSFDADDFGADLSWTISGLVNGVVQVNGVTQNTFTQADLDGGLVRFIHDGSETITAGFNVSVADGGEDGALPDTDSFSITITPVNEASVITANTGASVSEGGNVTITSAMLNSTDPDDAATGRTYTASNFSNGHITVSGVTQNTFTQDDINNNRVAFVHNGSDTLNAGFDILLIDGGENGTIADTDSFALSVTPVDDAPLAATNNGLSVNEGSTTVISVAALSTTDSDTNPADVIFTITSAPGNGHIALAASPGSAVTSFTLDDLQNNRVVYVHDGSETLADSFDFTVEDAATTLAGDIFAITITSLNDAPSITGDLAASLNEGGSYFLTAADLGAIDPDDTAANVIFTASSLANGIIQVNGLTQNSFTYDDVVNNLVRFVHNGGETVSAGFDVSLADGGENGALPDTASFAFTIIPVNDAPVLAVNTGAAMDEGTSVVIAGAMLAGVDPDDAATGLSYTASNLTNGHITVNGISQNSFTQADINNGLVRFIHDGGETIAAGFDISLADGGEDGAAVALGNFVIAVTPVNDTPTLATNIGATLDEGDAITLDNTMLAAIDIESAAAGLIYTITTLPAGILENTDTLDVLGVADSFTQNDLDNGFIRFTHDGSEQATSVLWFTIGDGTGTSAAQSFSFTINPVNDAPTALTMTGGTVAENSAEGTIVGTLETLDADLPGDALTYTIMNDPEGIFAISGNSIIVRGAIDFETMQSMNLMIQVDDGHGGVMQESFMVSITDLAERATSSAEDIFVRPEDDNRASYSFDDFGSFAQSEYLGFGRLDNADTGYRGQILREYTTLLYGGVLEDALPLYTGSFIPLVALIGAGDAAQNDAVAPPEQFTTLEQALAFMQSLQAADEQNASGNRSPENSMGAEEPSIVERQLQDIAAYQIERQQRLRDALTETGQ